MSLILTEREIPFLLRKVKVGVYVGKEEVEEYLWKLAAEANFWVFKTDNEDNPRYVNYKKERDFFASCIEQRKRLPGFEEISESEGVSTRTGNIIHGLDEHQEGFVRGLNGLLNGDYGNASAELLGAINWAKYGIWLYFNEIQGEATEFLSCKYGKENSTLSVYKGGYFFKDCFKIEKYAEGKYKLSRRTVASIEESGKKRPLVEPAGGDFLVWRVFTSNHSQRSTPMIFKNKDGMIKGVERFGRSVQYWFDEFASMDNMRNLAVE
jgi:hypothetical protein